MNDSELREKIKLVVPWLGNEVQLNADRPDLYALWKDYYDRKIGEALDGYDYEQKLNYWLLHYFLVHGKD